MNVNFNNVPMELKGLKQWVMWKYEVKEGKQTKVPYQANNAKASVTNSNHWGMLSEVEDAMKSGLFEGVGFVFTEEDDFTGVDIDGSVKDKELDDKTIFATRMLASYTELSPSETGIHIIVKGRLPEGYKNKNTEQKIECYNKARFFTFTGNKIAGENVEERNEALSKFAERYLVRNQTVHTNSPASETPAEIKNMDNPTLWLQIFKSKSGKKAKAFYRGEVENGDHSSSDLSLCNILAFWTNKDKERMDSMFRESGLMRSKWDKLRGKNTYGEITIARAINDTKRTIADSREKADEIVKELGVAEEVSGEIINPVTGRPSFDFTELGNGDRIVHYGKGKMVYCKGLEWLVWDGKRWCEDDTMKRELIVREALETLKLELLDADEEQSKVVSNWIRKCGSRNVRVNSLKDAIPNMSIKTDSLNRYPMMFNCDNGTVDLKRGELIPHDKDMMLTQYSNVKYDKEADCPEWKSFVSDILVDSEGNTDKDLVRFMQKAVGYTLTGDTSEQVMFFLLGGGRNGKSTFTTIVSELLGEYSESINPDTFTENKTKGINNDIAKLHASRYVSGSETKMSDNLSEALVKQVTGGEQISARFLHKDFFNFVPQFKVFFATNHKPRIEGKDEGIWRRIRLVPFLKDVKADEVRGDLKEIFRSEMSGILNWAIEGCQMWLEEGLEPPEIVKKAVDEYREEMDGVKPFLLECCDVTDPKATIKAKELNSMYKAWASANHLDDVLGRNSFFEALEAKGHNKVLLGANVLHITGIKRKFGYNAWD